jgi:hypothetical protein
VPPPAINDASALCQHAAGEEITAVCCLASVTADENLIVTVTAQRGEEWFKLHMWHLPCTRQPWGPFGHVSRYATYRTPTEISLPCIGEPGVLVSICALPLTAASDAAFATYSTSCGRNSIKLWSRARKSVRMRLMEQGKLKTVTELRCESSTTKMIATVNSERHTLIAACGSYLELWNVTTGVYNKWKPVMTFDCIPLYRSFSNFLP